MRGAFHQALPHFVDAAITAGCFFVGAASADEDNAGSDKGRASWSRRQLLSKYIALFRLIASPHDGIAGKEGAWVCPVLCMSSSNVSDFLSVNMWFHVVRNYHLVKQWMYCIVRSIPKTICIVRNDFYHCFTERSATPSN